VLQVMCLIIYGMMMFMYICSTVLYIFFCCCFHKYMLLLIDTLLVLYYVKSTLKICIPFDLDLNFGDCLTKYELCTVIPVW